MHTPTRRQPSRSSRAVAALAALFCLWMATVGVVGHTDDLQTGASASARVVLGHRLAPSTHADSCAACQWLSAVQTPNPVVPVVTLPYRFAPWSYPASPSRTLGRSRLQNGTRAPPALSLLPFALS